MKKLSIIILGIGIIFSTEGFAQFESGSEGTLKCLPNQYEVGSECVACPTNATCNGRTATCRKNMVTMRIDGKVECKKSPVATVQNGKVKMQCRHESHTGIDWIRRSYRNCTKCGIVDVAAGKCPSNRNPHQHYYCDCAC